MNGCSIRRRSIHQTICTFSNVNTYNISFVSNGSRWSVVAYMYATVHSLAVIKQNVKYNLMSCTARRNKSPLSSVWVEQWLQWIKKHEISEAVVLLEDKYSGIPWFSFLSLNTYSHELLLQYSWGSAISSSWQRPQTVCATDSLRVVTIVTGI